MHCACWRTPEHSAPKANSAARRVNALGGSVAAIGFITKETDESTCDYSSCTGQDIVVGVNRFQKGEQLDIDLLRVDPQSEREQLDRLAAFKADRDGELVERRLEELRAVARGSENLLPAIHDALRDRRSLGEVCGAMRDVFGRYRPQL